MINLLIGPTVQGVGAGGIFMLGEIITSDLVPLNERGKWLGWLGSMWTAGGVVGPLAGGAFLQQIGWPWLFWLILPFVGFGSIVLQLFLKQETISDGKLEKVIRVDWVGVLLFTTSTAAILVPLTCGGIILDWKDWRLIVPVISGFNGFALLYTGRICSVENRCSASANFAIGHFEAPTYKLSSMLWFFGPYFTTCPFITRRLNNIPF